MREGLVAIQCGAFHLASGGKKYFNTTPLGRVVTTTAIVRAMIADDGPDKLSMERVAEPAFTPEDRIGALELQNLSIGDNRNLLIHHLASVRKLAAPQGELVGLLGVGDAAADRRR